MKLKDFYDSVIEEGIKRDPRGIKGVKAYLAKINKEYSGLPSDEKEFFDTEKLKNPYSDTRLLFSDGNKDIKNIMVGIDAETPELLLADSLRKKGKKIDLVISHHPQGFARSIFYEVMNVQHDILRSLGIKSKKAAKMLDDRISEIARKVHPGNAMRPVDAAKLLNIAYMCTHTVADNCVSDYLNGLLKKNKPKTVGCIVDILMNEPEYKYAKLGHSGPKLISGKMSNRCGKIALEMTGGTEGPKKIFSAMTKAGVKTIVGMHMSEEHFKQAQKHSLNILLAGHISSDNVGMNLLIDAVDKKNRLKIIPCSGFIRARRR
ncbi:NGG1p interacting factor NIF3 [Candidatus Omnitrophota bacterium]